MNDLIREAVKCLPQQESLPADLAAVNRRMRDIRQTTGQSRSGRRVGGGQLRPLLEKMDSLETSRLPLQLKQRS